jgi:hypothetical protein
MNNNFKKALIASIHIARKDMALDEETYRIFLAGVTGKTSSGQCTVPQLKAVLAEFRSRGWRPRERKPNPLTPLRSKIAALLASQDLPREYADGILGRMYGVSVKAADRQQLTACVTALTKRAVAVSRSTCLGLSHDA